jgi:glycosyltransferase involved in cell wall biosynthesis
MSNMLSVVIPAYNEEDGIADIIERVLATKTPLATGGVSDLELIVVDDASRDRTPEIVAGYPEVVRELVGFSRCRWDFSAGVFPPALPAYSGRWG